MPKAKLFMNGGSQAVRLPAEFRFEGREVDVRRDPKTGDVILSGSRKFDVEALIALIETLDVPKDFMKNREKLLDHFRDPFANLNPDELKHDD